ncbi:MAG: P63C domain-containing protein, partial [Planctomycetota bacterium]
MPQVCNVFLEADDADVLASNQKHIAAKCRILIRGFAVVGISALIDEATGYQYDRAREALEQILEQFIAKELFKWVKTFPDEFYQQLFRLRGWRYSSQSIKRPAVVGKLTNNLIYERIAPGVLEELRDKNPKTPKGTRKHR